MKTFGEMLAGLDGGDALVQKFGRETVEDSIAALAKSYQSAEQRVHGSVKPPGADASDEEWSSFMQKIGAPGSATEYQAPEGVDSSVAARAAEIASQAAMTQRQYERVVKQMDAETQARIDRALMRIRAIAAQAQSKKLDVIRQEPPELGLYCRIGLRRPDANPTSSPILSRRSPIAQIPGPALAPLNMPA